jgi:hypothetical protein
MDFDAVEYAAVRGVDDDLPTGPGRDVLDMEVVLIGQVDELDLRQETEKVGKFVRPKCELILLDPLVPITGTGLEGLEGQSPDLLVVLSNESGHLSLANVPRQSETHCALDLAEMELVVALVNDLDVSLRLKIDPAKGKDLGDISLRLLAQSEKLVVAFVTHAPRPLDLVYL